MGEGAACGRDADQFLWPSGAPMIGLHDYDDTGESSPRAALKAVADEGFIIRRIDTSEDGFFDLTDEGGIEAGILGVRDFNETYDAIAWALDDPARWWSLRGVASLLGVPALHRANFLNKPVRLVATPKDWMQETVIRGPHDGPVCVVDWSQNPKLTLGMAPAIECADFQLATHLRKSIEQHNAPQFRIFAARQGARHAA
ncbi:MAG: hypothetical protein ACYC1L_18530 [Alphaproteobacteria bacterium]